MCLERSAGSGQLCPTYPAPWKNPFAHTQLPRPPMPGGRACRRPAPPLKEQPVERKKSRLGLPPRKQGCRRYGEEIGSNAQAVLGNRPSNEKGLLTNQTIPAYRRRQRSRTSAPVPHAINPIGEGSGTEAITRLLAYKLSEAVLPVSWMYNLKPAASPS